MPENSRRNCKTWAFTWSQKLAEHDADKRGLLKVDIGGGLFPKEGYMTIDQEGGDITCDLNEGIPLPDNSVGVINASHVIEHLRDPIKKTMSRKSTEFLLMVVGHLLRSFY